MKTIINQCKNHKIEKLNIPNTRIKYSINNNDTIFKMLYELDPSIVTKDEVLELIIQRGGLDLIQFLVNKKLNVNQEVIVNHNNVGTLLYRALCNGNFYLAEYLLSVGADISYTRHVFVIHTTYCYKIKDDINIKHIEKRSMLFAAVVGQSIDCIKLVLNKNIKEENSNCPSILAFFYFSDVYYDLKTLEFLLHKGTNINDCDSFKRTVSNFNILSNF